MSNEYVVRDKFKADPRGALTFVRSSILGRNRRTLVLLRSLLVCIDELRGSDPALACELAERVIALTDLRSQRRSQRRIKRPQVRAVKALAQGVYASALTALGEEDWAEVVLDIALRVRPIAPVRGTLHMRRAMISVRRFRYPEALARVDKAVGCFVGEPDDWDSFATSYESALMVRVFVLVNEYQLGNGSLENLRLAEKDAELAKHSRYAFIRESARDALVVLTAFRGLQVNLYLVGYLWIGSPLTGGVLWNGPNVVGLGHWPVVRLTVN